MSTPPLFTVALRDLERGPRIVRAPLPLDFLTRLLADTDVTPQSEPEARISLSVESTDRQVLVRGDLDVTVAVPCARTLDPAVYRLRPEVFLLLSPSGDGGGREGGARTTGMQRRNRAGGAAAAGNGPARATEQKSRAKKGAWDDDPELEAGDAAQDTYSGDQVVLDDFIREFILLEIPMVPLREDLRSQDFEASPPPPSPGPGPAPRAEGAPSPGEVERPLDPRLSPLAELKARLEKKKE